MDGTSATPRPPDPRASVKVTRSVSNDSSGAGLDGPSAGVRGEPHARAGVGFTADPALILATLFDTEAVGLAVLDEQTRVLAANDTLCSMLGRSPDEVIGRPFDSFREPDLGAASPGHALPSSSDRVTVQRLRVSSGEAAWATIDLRPLNPATNSARTVAVVQDMTALQQSTEALERTSRFDSATGLANRASFRACVEREMARVVQTGEQLALFWLDLDRFKEVNDQHGHATGDTVLCVVAERLQSMIHGQGIVGRAGGDEFALLLPGPPEPGDLDVLLERVLVAVHEPIVDDSGDQVHISGSVGVALYPEDAQSADNVMRSAEQAMHAAKVAGGSTFRYFRRDMNTRAEHGRTMRHQLAAAIDQRAFELHYQPIVDPRDGAVHGVEALVRWVRDGAVATADQFIHFCEASGQIRPLGLITLDLLRQDVGRIRAAGHTTLPVSVNLSATQLADAPHLEALRAWPEPRALAGVEVEVTESVFLPDNNRAAEAVAQLAVMGASISVDDFGTGFSNLRMLQTLAPAKIKLDQSFLTDHNDAHRSRTLMEVAIHMAHTLGAVVIVEGVEDQSQRDRAEHLGADLVQGFCIAGPMPVDDLIIWLADRPIHASTAHRGGPAH